MDQQPLPERKTKMPLSEIITALGDARKAASNAYMRYKELKDIEDQLRYELELELRFQHLKSVKGADYSAVLTETPRIVIKQEHEVMAWLQEAPDIETDRYVGVKSAEFQTLAKSLLKGTGEIIPGTTVEVRETLAIRAIKPKENKPNVT